MKEVTKYRVLTFTRYLGDSFFYPFFSMLLKNQGLVEGKIGFILSISPLVGIITNPIYTKICKNPKITKNILSIISGIEAIMIIAISCSSSFYVISALTLLLAIFGSCHYGLMDSLLTLFSNEKTINYSSIRLYGSIAYIIGTTVGGFLINLTNFKICFLASCILFILSSFLYFLLKPLQEESENKPKVKLSSLLKVKGFVYFLILYTLLMGSINAGDHFFSVYLLERGLTSSTYGMVYSYYVIIEVILLAIFSKASRKINNNLLLVIASAALCLRFLVNGLYAPLWLVIILAGLRGVAFAVILHVSYQTVLKIVGKEKATTGIMLITLGQAIFVFIFNNIDGNLIEITKTYRYYYLLMGLFSLITMVLTIIRYFTCQKIVKNE